VIIPQWAATVLRKCRAGGWRSGELRDLKGGPVQTVLPSGVQDPVWSPDRRIIYSLDEPGLWANSCNYWVVPINTSMGPEAMAAILWRLYESACRWAWSRCGSKGSTTSSERLLSKDLAGHRCLTKMFLDLDRRMGQSLLTSHRTEDGKDCSRANCIPTNSEKGELQMLTQPPARKAVLTFLWLVLFSLPAFADHVHHLWYNNNNWQDEDLTVETGAPLPYSVAGITAFHTTPNQQLHVYYVANFPQHVHQLYYNGTSWSDEDLTAATGAPDAGDGISGFNIGNYQYVFYVGLFDTHVHELSYVNNWTDTDLTATVGGPLATFGGFVAFATKPNNQFHVYYQDTNFPQHLHQLYFNGTVWSDEDLSAATNAYCQDYFISGFATGNLQHIICPGFAFGFPGYLDMMHIYYNNASWVYEDITAKSGSADLYQGPSETGFAVGKQGEVYGITFDTHIHQYTYKGGKWTDLDLTFNDGAPANVACGAMTSFPTPVNNQFHIYYTPTTSTNQVYADVYQLYFNGSTWSAGNLTNSGQAYVCGGMSGFAIGNLQHVFYFASGN
jgi:hypothetical protein